MSCRILHEGVWCGIGMGCKARFTAKAAPNRAAKRREERCRKPFATKHGFKKAYF